MEAEDNNPAVVGLSLHLNCLVRQTYVTIFPTMDGLLTMTQRTLREAIYSESEPGQSVNTSSMAVTGQCIEILRRHLMCTFDPTIYLIANSMKSAKGSGPVMGNPHYCRNSNKISDWIEEHGDGNNSAHLSTLLGL